MKTTRFNAAIKGKTDAAMSEVRLQMVENILKSNELTAEAKALSINTLKNNLVQEIASCSPNDLRGAIQRLADLIQEEKAIKESKTLSKDILEVLNEEIEVEE